MNRKVLTAFEARQMMSSNKMSVTEYAQSCLDRIRDIEPSVHAWKYLNDDMFMEQAKRLQSEKESGKAIGKLHGIPVGIKDIFNTSDMPTCMGSPIWEGFTPGNDARVVASLRDEGSIIAGKTVTAEFAVNHAGPTRNPHDAERITGTSSSGSAVAVATGMVPLALGTQTAGSTIRPASYCGIYGFKPSFGIIPRTGILKTLDTLDHVSLFSRSPEDMRLMLDVVRVRGGNHPFIKKFMDDDRRTNKDKWKIAFVHTPVWGHAQEYTKEAMVKFAEKISTLDKVDLDMVELPGVFTTVHDVHARIYEKALSYYFQEEYQEHGDQVSKLFRDMVERGMQVSHEKYLEGLEQQTFITAELDRFFDQYDIVLSHSTAGEAPLVSSNNEPPDPCLIWTFCHTPSVNLPIFTGPNGMPFGAQLVSRRYHDYYLLDFMDYLNQEGLLDVDYSKRKEMLPRAVI
jgi:Asp-tRNA(Asn)/Glu-tRNA(Gln) amidotransferase A subunit family amidase